MNHIKKTLSILPLFSLFLLTNSSYLHNSSLLFTSVNSDYIEEKLYITGNIPNFINGTIYRNGFGKFEGHNFKLNHLFDSFSLILKFKITNGNVYFQSRLLNSKYYNDSLHKIPLYRTLGGTKPSMDIKENIETKMHFMHDNLNANVIMIKDKLFAISDLAGDILIEKETLQYQEKYIFMNDEKNNFITSAHPEKWSVNRNIIINYESDLENMIYKFYYIDLSDNNQQIKKNYFIDIPTTRFSYIHSFSLTKRYIIFIEYPFYWDIESIVDSVVILPTLKWDLNSKTKIHIISIDYNQQDVITIETEPFFSFHHINAFDFYSNVSNKDKDDKDKDGKDDNSKSDCTNIFLELITYPDTKIFDAFYMNDLLNTSHHNNDKFIKGGNYSKIIINIDNRNKISYFKMFTKQINNETIEMPTVNPNYKGDFYKYFYAFTESGKLIKVDIISGEVKEWKENKHIPSEPIFIPYNNNNNNNNNNKNNNKNNYSENQTNFNQTFHNYSNIYENNSCVNDFIQNNIYKSYELYSKYKNYYQKYLIKYGSDFNEDDGVIVSLVLDTIKGLSYLLFLDAKTMTEIAKGYMSTHIPLTCHGFYQSN
jgi:beta,beta-carotene 9',10'-dioxygenase